MDMDGATSSDDWDTLSTTSIDTDSSELSSTQRQVSSVAQTDQGLLESHENTLEASEKRTRTSVKMGNNGSQGRRVVRILKNTPLGQLEDTPSIESTTTRTTARTIASEGGCVSLGDNNFQQTVSKGIWLVKHYRPTCKYSKQLEPVWDELVAQSQQIRFAQVDCAQYGGKRLIHVTSFAV
jgi:hypothetical protein